MLRLSPETHTLYAELLDQLSALEARRSIGILKGCFTTKEIKGETYCYFQHVALDGSLRQIYLGRKSPALDDLAAAFKEERAVLKPDLERIRKLCAQIRAGGGLCAEAPHTRVIAALAASGVFRLGGVLVGTHAFAAMGNMLGVNWEDAVKTQDIDIAAPKRIDVALLPAAADVPAALESLKLGFLPVPQLDNKNPSTSFKVRGSTLTVDMLTPGAKESMPHLDYLMEAAERAAVVGGEGVLVNLPAPARFAFHKLIVSRERAAAWQAKSGKDFSQAAALLVVLAEDRPGDILLAYDALASRGQAWIARLKKVLPAFAAKCPEGYGKLLAVLPKLTK